jgi:hypothetical protein
VEARELISSVCNFLDESNLKNVFSSYTAAMFPDLNGFAAIRDVMVGSTPAQIRATINAAFPGQMFQLQYLYDNRDAVFQGYELIRPNTYNIGPIGSGKIGLYTTASSLKISYFKGNNTEDGLNYMEIIQGFHWDTRGSPFIAGTKLDDIVGPRVNFIVCANVLKIIAKIMKIEYIGLNDAAAMPCLGPSKATPIMFSAENDYLGEIVGGNHVNPPTRAPTATNIYPIQISHISIVRIIGGKEAFYRLAEGIPHPQPAANGLTYQQLLNTVLPRISEEHKNYCRNYLADAKPSKAGALNFLRSRFARNDSTDQCIERCVNITGMVENFLNEAAAVIQERGIPGNHRAVAEQILFNWVVPTGYRPGDDTQAQSIAHRAARSAERQSVERSPIGFNPLKWWRRRKYSVARKKLSHLINRPSTAPRTHRSHRRLHLNDLYPRQTRVQKLKRFGRDTWDFLKYFRRRKSGERIFSAKKRALKRFSGARRGLGLTARISQKRRLGLQTQRRR